MGAIIVVDAFWGDAGKGKFSAYFSNIYDATACARCGIGPNAGHSIFRDNVMTSARLVPLGLVNPKTQLLIGSGVAIDPEVLIREIEENKVGSRISVDHRCPIITKTHINYERDDCTMKQIDSTKSGAGSARSDYVLRKGQRAIEIEALKPYVNDVAVLANKAASKGTLIVEGSQGTFLSLFLSERYPYVTSDNCTTAAFIDDLGLNWQFIDRVVLLVKCLPTAVGNGPLPHEMSFEEIERRGLVEFGTNTGRLRRRVSKIDEALLKYSVMLNGPTEIALTYCDQYDPQMRDVMSSDRLTPKISRLISRIEKIASVPVTFLDTGKEFRSIVNLKSD